MSPFMGAAMGAFMTDLTCSMTYSELSAARAITAAATRTLVRRKRWERVRGNDGLVRIQVPLGEIEDRANGESPHGSLPEGAHERAHDGAPERAHEAPPGTLQALAILDRHTARQEAAMEALQKALKEALSARDVEREKAIAIGMSNAALRATLEAVTNERDWLRDRRWWQRHKRV